ncbi:CBS domain-containing protein [Patescibacteria group bacterium]|nr:CBS domain-containing protein [Patescibacteria group bacterium]MCL5010482.1 CBS domain-containing protein [Patescibacteria group bacterium]
MKLLEIMQKTVVTVSPDQKIKEVARIIFNLGISGVPVVKGGKLIGIVTEQDILIKLYPSMQDLIEDYVHAKSFEAMEHNLKNIFDMSIKELMNEQVISVSPNVSLMEAQSKMLINRVSRLPVIDAKGHLLGIVSQGDIFRQLIKNELPKLETQSYASFVARYYNLMVNWGKRLNYEFPVLLNLLKTNNAQSILDIGVWTGRYTLELAKKTNYKILGLDHNEIMVDIANKERNKLASQYKKRVDFMLTDFTNFSDKISRKFDAAICMGNSLPYIPVSLKTLFKQIYQLLDKKNGIFIIQTLNLEKLLIKKDRLLNFKIQKSRTNDEKEHLLMEFFDRKAGNILFHHTVIFDSDGENWIFKGITTIKIHYITDRILLQALKESGFNKISIAGNMGEYQGEYGKLSFTNKFDRLESDWLNAVAER